MPKGIPTPKASMTEDTTTLTMALIGYEMEKVRIDEKIAEIRAHLGGHPSKATTKKRSAASNGASSEPAEGEVTKKRTMSPAARKRIAAAQRKRWAEHRKTLAAEA